MISTILGGIGMFLLGMILLTEGLKSAAGDALRSVLSRFTGGPVSALLSGTLLTALVQSSSATTLTTIGFVSAGLLTFAQAVGVIFGANLGTTSTSWIVSTLGLKLDIAAAALPLVGAGALLKLLARGRAAAIGMSAAGFGLMFIGIDILQTGMSDLATRVDPSSFPEPTLSGRLLLVLIGALMAVIMQSSSAAVATTLTALHSSTIDLYQAATLVVGQNIGTTVTAAIAAVGASVPARRTALAHILFNGLTGLIAFAILPLFVRLVDGIADRIGGGDDAMSLAAFHTAFNLLGVAVLLPFIRPFANLVTRLVPERGAALTRNLDATVATVGPVAVEAARRTLAVIASEVWWFQQMLLRKPRPGEPAQKGRRDGASLDELDDALGEVRRFLGRVRSTPTEAEHARHLSALHAIDHLHSTVVACREARQAAVVAADAHLQQTARAIGDEINLALQWLRGEENSPVATAEALSTRIGDERRTHRPALIGRAAAGEVDPDAAVAQLDAMRWLDRLAYHLWRTIHHLQVQPAPAQAAQTEAFSDVEAEGGAG